ncbi:O-sialoglycoprotein endopeptidase [Clostridia bacterium]|nr:O-sialoglycoprotein endopeptidase [Clostridia bacterium]
MKTLGIDTSNYTTSAALCDNGKLTGVQLPLPVPEGALGLRQSDAVFHHVRQLPEALRRLDLSGVQAIGVSVRPRAAEGSYMPCFLAGESAARLLGQSLGVPVRKFSHQQGHLAAAALGSGHAELLDGNFLAWHVSGGTTELLLVDKLNAQIIGGTTDLCAGQLIDRVGKTLGLPFPSGQALEKLSGGLQPVKIKNTGLKFSLSGYENKARTESNAASFVLSVIAQSLINATETAKALYDLPVLCSGGVMSNKYLQDCVDAYFAPPEYSRDNAMGAAYLACRGEEWTA